MNSQHLLFTDCADIVGSACQPFAGTKKYISTGAVETDHINDDAIEIVDYSDKPSRANLEVAAGDILFAKMQGTKKTLSIDSALAKNIYSTGFCAVRAKEGVITSRCLYHLLTSKTFLAQKDKFCSGATQKAITNSGLNEITVTIPDIKGQEIIATQLDATAGIIAKRQQQLQKLDDLIKARFVEMFGDPVINPKSWPTKHLLSMGTCKNGMNFHYNETGIEIHCLGVGDFQNNSIIRDTTTLPIVSLNEMPSEEYLLHDNDIVFVRSNGNKALVGRSVVVYPGTIPTTFSGFCIRYRNHDDAITIPYLLRALKTDSIRIKMSGRGANIQNLNQQMLGKLTIPVPPIKLQNAFAIFSQSVTQTKSLVQRSLAQAQTLFAALMQEHFG